MTETWFQASLWLFLSLAAALSEIVGCGGSAFYRCGAIALTFLAIFYTTDFAKLKKRTEQLKDKAKFEVAIGHPAEKIIQRADELKADAIVMGHRGKSLMERWLLGSVSKRVLSYAHCTVIVVR